MKLKEVKKALKKLGPWYQRYEMLGEYTTEKTTSTDIDYNIIRTFIREDDLNGVRILDLGANAAYFSVKLALEGADVIVVEPDPIYFKQARWTKHFFEQTRKKGKLVMTYYNKTASELDYNEMGWCDYIIASSVLYHIGSKFGAYSEKAIEEQKRVVGELCKLTNRIIVRTRNNRIENSIGFYNSMFLEHEFYMIKRVMKKRPLMLYGRLEKNGDYGIY